MAWNMIRNPKQPTLDDIAKGKAYWDAKAIDYLRKANEAARAAKGVRSVTRFMDLKHFAELAACEANKAGIA